MGRALLAGISVALVLAAAGCGGGGSSTYALDKTSACLKQHGANVGGKLDFVAQTATGGAFRVDLGDNYLTVAFGQSVNDGVQIELAYQRFAYANVRAGLADVLRRYDNAVTLWHAHPSDTDLALVVGCLS